MQKSPKIILVIDDDPGTIRLLEKWLNVAGYDVISALNGETGLRRAKEALPNLILLDVMIPDLSGAEISRMLRADPQTSHIPIVFITVTISKKQDKIQKKLVIDGQSYDAFAKPLYQPKLLSVVKRLIKRSVRQDLTNTS